MKKFIIFTGLGFGITVGVWLAYSFTYSESVRLVVSILGAVLLTATLILTTAWIIASSLAKAYGNRRDQYQYRYDQRPQFPGGMPYQPGLPPGQHFYQQQQYIPANQLDWVEGEAGREEIVG